MINTNTIHQRQRIFFSIIEIVLVWFRPVSTTWQKFSVFCFLFSFFLQDFMDYLGGSGFHFIGGFLHDTHSLLCFMLLFLYSF